MKERLQNKWVIAGIGIVLISALVKIFYILNIPGPIIYGDELLYRRRAAEILYMQTYKSSSYPLGYPLVISLCFLFDNFYIAIQIMNVLLSILGIIAVWKIIRLYTTERNCFWGIVIISLLPWQYLFCARVMSENLFYPVLMWTIYFFLRTMFMEEVKKLYCVILGLMLACMHLTRHMTITFLPIFALFWLIEVKDNGHYTIRLSVKKIIQGCFVLMGYIALYGVWIALRKSSGDVIWKILGFNISNGIGGTNIKYATFHSLIVFLILYISYLVLCLLYTIPVIIQGIKQCILGNTDKRIAKAGALFVGLCCMAIIATVRHSWRSEYNYPDIQYLLGRYIIYIPIILIIFVQIARDSYTKEDRKSILMVYQVIETLSIFISGQILVRGQLFDLREKFLETVNSQEVCYIYYMYVPILILSVIKGIIVFFKEKAIYVMTDICMIVTLIIGCRFDLDIKDYELSGIFGETLYELSQKRDLTEYDYIINDTPAVNMEFDIEFWLGTSDKPIVVENRVKEKEVLPENSYYSGYHRIKLYNASDSDKAIIDEGKGIIFCPTMTGEEGMISCEHQGVEYSVYVYECPIRREIKLLKSYPSIILCGESFNVQENGESALVLETNLPPGLYDLYVDDQYYTDFCVAENGMGSALIGEELYQNVCVLSIKVKSKGEMPWYIEICEPFELQVIDLVNE